VENRDFSHAPAEQTFASNGLVLNKSRPSNTDVFLTSSRRRETRGTRRTRNRVRSVQWKRSSVGPCIDVHVDIADVLVVIGADIFDGEIQKPHAVGEKRGPARPLRPVNTGFVAADKTLLPNGFESWLKK